MPRPAAALAALVAAACLHAVAAEESATAHVPANAWEYRGDNCHGIRHHVSTGLEHVFFTVVSDSHQNTLRNWGGRTCPPGSRWMSTAEYQAEIAKPGVVCNSEEYNYYSQCGWSNYRPGPTGGPYLGNNRVLFYFSDTMTTRVTMHAAHKECQTYNYNNAPDYTYPAGMVCIDDGDTEPPAFETDEEPALVPGSVTTSAAAFSAKLDEEGSLHCVAMTGDGTPTGEQVKSGNGGADPVASSPSREAAGTELVATFADLEPATLYHVWCVAEDAVDALGNVQETATLAGDIFTAGCEEGDASVALPTFDVAGSGIVDGDLQLRWDSSRHLASHRFAFRGKDGVATCSMAAAAAAGEEPAGDAWSLEQSAVSCDETYTFAGPLAPALADCGFVERDSDATYTRYFATVEVTTTETRGEVFGDGAPVLTRQGAVEFGLEFPTRVDVSAEVEAYGSVLTAAALSQQQANAVSREFTWTLATSVQYPYYLEARAATSNTPAGFAAPLPVGSGGDCSGEGGACTQLFAVTGTPESAVCTLDGSATLTFDVRCRATDVACDLPEPATQDVTFAYRAADFCARVVEVASVTPTLTTYSDAPDGTVSTDFVLGTEVFARVALVTEGGVDTASVELTDVTILSACSGCATPLRTPLANGLVVDAVDDWSVTNGAGAAQPHADFSFRLSTSSVSFDLGAGTGAVDITLTATVRITYVEAGSQATRTRLVRVASSGSSQLASAGARLALVSSEEERGGASSSGSSGSVMPAGTVMLGAVAAVAVVAVAAAAVAVRRRRQRTGVTRKAVASSSSSSLELGEPARAAQPAPVALGQETTDSLRAVEAAYAVVQVE